jgi:DNA ligase-1
MIRLFECKLRIGLALRTILISLSQAFDESDYEIIKDDFDNQSDFEYLTENLLKYGIKDICKVCTIVPGIPLKTMLAQPSKKLTKAFSRFEDVTFLSEYKYDGERVQIHHFDGVTKIFSRNNEDSTMKFPDISKLKLSDKSFILDGEVVAFKNGEILPFQILSTRKRKNEEFTQEKIEALPASFIKGKKLKNEDINNKNINDEIANENSEDLSMEENLQELRNERRNILFGNFKEIDEKFKFATGIVCTSIEDIDAQLKNSIQANCEGLMLKSLNSIYKPSHRSNSWNKLKKDYLDTLGDSVDLVVIDAFYGKGKRTGAFGGFLLGSYNDETDLFEPCCKIGTGFSDENLKNFYNILGPLITAYPSQIAHNVKGVIPNVWIDPTYVWEVKAASLSLSPIYITGDYEKGISLRFPRFIKERPDRKPKDATTSNQLIRMYQDNKNEESEEDEFN